MSFVHPYNDTQRHLYQLSPIFPGWVEFFTAGPGNPKRLAVRNKFMKFWGMLKIMSRWLTGTSISTRSSSRPTSAA